MDSFDFNIDEIYEIAAQIERNGKKFYSDTASSLKDDPEIQAFLIDLANQEEQHEKTFYRILGSISKNNTYTLENELAVQYLDAMARQFVFKSSQAEYNKVTASKSLKEILNFAIQKEKDSILFYNGLKEILTDAKDLKALNLIINEEKKHLVELEQFIRKIN